MMLIINPIEPSQIASSQIPPLVYSTKTNPKIDKDVIHINETDLCYLPTELSKLKSIDTYYYYYKINSNKGALSTYVLTNNTTPVDLKVHIEDRNLYLRISWNSGKEIIWHKQLAEPPATAPAQAMALELAELETPKTLDFFQNFKDAYGKTEISIRKVEELISSNSHLFFQIKNLKIINVNTDYGIRPQITIISPAIVTT